MNEVGLVELWDIATDIHGARLRGELAGFGLAMSVVADSVALQTMQIVDSSIQHHHATFVRTFSYSRDFEAQTLQWGKWHACEIHGNPDRGRYHAPAR